MKNTNESNSEYVNVREAHVLLNVSEFTVRTYIKTDQLPATKKKVGKRYVYLISKEAINKFIEKSKEIE
jgi:excisionase family DNA binding protein